MMNKLSWVLTAIFFLFLISGCTTTVLNPVSDSSHRESVLSPTHCGFLYRQVDHRIKLAADVDRGRFQIRLSEDLDRFDTDLFTRWQEDVHTPVYTGVGEETYDEFSFSPHILNYDLLGDIYYYGCDGESQSAAGRFWYGDRGPVEQNKSRAALHYEFAALGHVSRSQYRLGRMLVEGDGIPQDTEMGLKWLVAASIEGNDDARAYLQKKGIENIPDPIFPNTFQVLAANERRMRAQHQRLAEERRAERAEDWANVILIGLVLLGAYYSADTAASTQSVAQPSPAAKSRSVSVQRPVPVFCNSQINMTGITSGSLTLVNGTISTFCPGA